MMLMAGMLFFSKYIDSLTERFYFFLFGSVDSFHVFWISVHLEEYETIIYCGKGEGEFNLIERIALNIRNEQIEVGGTLSFFVSSRSIWKPARLQSKKKQKRKICWKSRAVMVLALWTILFLFFQKTFCRFSYQRYRIVPIISFFTKLRWQLSLRAT